MSTTSHSSHSHSSLSHSSLTSLCSPRIPPGLSSTSRATLASPPPPPPTVNRLSARQKAQLRRTTTKLTKVLGAAPQVVDSEARRSIDTSRISVPKKLQPSLSISSDTSSAGRIAHTHRRARSATVAATSGSGCKVDPDLYPLSSAPRPASCDLCRPHTHSHALRRSSESRRSASERRARRRSRPMSISSDCTFLSMEDSDVENGEDEKGSFVIIYPRPRPRPESTVSSTSTNRDSLMSCNSLYEPTFAIPSARKMRLEKMARVQKLLGEDVPVELVFPIRADKENDDADSEDHSDEEKRQDDRLPLSPVPNAVRSRIGSPTKVMDAHARGDGSRQRAVVSISGVSGVFDIVRPTDEAAIAAAGTGIGMPSPPPASPPPKYEMRRKPVPAMYYNTTTGPGWASRPQLETIIEQTTPRESTYSTAGLGPGLGSGSGSGRSSMSSFLSSTTSSSYRFTSSSALGLNLGSGVGPGPGPGLGLSRVSESVSVSESAPLPSFNSSSSSGSGPRLSSDSDSGHSSSSSDSPTPSPSPATPISDNDNDNNNDSERDRISQMYIQSSGTPYGRREFAIYMPFTRSRTGTRTGNRSYQAEFAKMDENEKRIGKDQQVLNLDLDNMNTGVVRGMLDLRV